MAKRKTTNDNAATRAAVSVGTALGKAAARFDAWLEQRDAVARELSAVIGRAQGMLSSIGKPGGKRKKAKSPARRKTAKTRKSRTAGARRTAKKAR